MSHIQQIRDENRHILHMVLTWASLSEAEHSGHKYEMGCDYIRQATGDEFVSRQIERSAIFWGWWSKEWAKRDDVYTSTVQTVFHSSASRRRIWYDWHCMEVFFGEGPTARDLSAGFSQIIGLIIREATKKQ